MPKGNKTMGKYRYTVIKMYRTKMGTHLAKGSSWTSENLDAVNYLKNDAKSQDKNFNEFFKVEELK